jgi:hypothetical protein
VFRQIFIMPLFLACLAASAEANEPLRESFEGEDLSPGFVPCRRPEGLINVSTEIARSGTRSMKLAIDATPFGTASWTPKPTSCLINGRENEYESDSTERAEIWESFDFVPRFGDDLYYGFSMWIGRDSAPIGNPTRLVIGQWKAPIDDSPFLAQRFTGGAFHVTLDVDASALDPETGRPAGCKILLAFDPSLTVSTETTEAPAPLDHPVRCEPKDQGVASNLAPAEPVAVERFAYLPAPFDRWIDLVYRVRGGPDGLVEIWADGQLIARASGRIGHNGAVGQVQYFKFGPYRDPASHPTTVFIDNLGRGRQFTEVDPSHP